MSYLIQMHVDLQTAQKLQSLAEKHHLTTSGAAASIIFQFFEVGPSVLTKKAPRVKVIARPTWRILDPIEAKLEVDRMNKQVEDAKKAKRAKK